MPMPEAAMYKDHHTMLREGEVGSAGQVFAMKPKSQSQSVGRTAHPHFGRRILAADAGH